MKAVNCPDPEVNIGRRRFLTGSAAAAAGENHDRQTALTRLVHRSDRCLAGRLDLGHQRGHSSRNSRAFYRVIACVLEICYLWNAGRLFWGHRHSCLWALGGMDGSGPRTMVNHLAMGVELSGIGDRNVECAGLRRGDLPLSRMKPLWRASGNPCPEVKADAGALMVLAHTQRPRTHGIAGGPTR